MLFDAQSSYASLVNIRRVFSPEVLKKPFIRTKKVHKMLGLRKGQEIETMSILCCSHKFYPRASLLYSALIVHDQIPQIFRFRFSRIKKIRNKAHRRVFSPSQDE